MRRNFKTIFAYLQGSRTCAAEGIQVIAGSPILKLCRELIVAGYDPRCRMEVLRRGKLCFVVRSIGEGAALRVTERRDGRPIFGSQSDAAASQSDLRSIKAPALQKVSRAA